MELANKGLKTLLPVPRAPWADISLEFAVKNSATQDAIMVVVDQYSHIAPYYATS